LVLSSSLSLSPSRSQIFMYLAFSAASLLIVLRMYVTIYILGDATIFPKELPFAHRHCQYRYLEQKQVDHSDRDWHMGD
jgi:hypothetical protein